MSEGLRIVERSDEDSGDMGHLEEMCEHMRALIAYCQEHGVFFGGCGDCGSAWLKCRACHLEVEEAHLVFGAEAEL